MEEDSDFNCWNNHVLCQNNLTLRGHRHTEEFDQRDNGVFLRTFELLAKHDSKFFKNILKNTTKEL